MVRPPDLPQPVRNHEPHESFADAAKRRYPVPGPGAYPGAATLPKSRVGGIFMYSSRFSRGQLVPTDLRTPTFRENALDVPGPKYDPILELKTREPVRFSRAPREVKDERDDNPGPGQYSLDIARKKYWNRGVSFAKSQRERARIVPEPAPAPGAYTPSPIVRHKPSASFGSAPRFRSSSTLPPPSPAASMTTTASLGGPRSSSVLSQFTGDETSPGPKYDPDYTFTRPKVAPDISFGRAPRTFARPTSATTGVSAYDITYSAIDKRPRSAVLYTGA